MTVLHTVDVLKYQYLQYLLPKQVSIAMPRLRRKQESAAWKFRNDNGQFRLFEMDCSSKIPMKDEDSDLSLMLYLQKTRRMRSYNQNTIW